MMLYVMSSNGHHMICGSVLLSDGVIFIDPVLLQGKKVTTTTDLSGPSLRFNLVFFLCGNRRLVVDGQKVTRAVLCVSVVYVMLSCTFWYGRQDEDVMGVAFRRDLFLVTRQVYPELQDKDKLTHTKTQQKLLRKLGDNGFPFFFEVRNRFRYRTRGSHLSSFRL
ncbi:hypothetical protein F2P81_026211 [Scophthalmus maximus]|uniref:S-arrestin n=1 Tax=Scophthalmus maximus TaxID=52904 RepID=A0A6A4RGC2_SCOMX|nr:hypothetical protein F2P81_026211 [Scophthalmus maximus]